MLREDGMECSICECHSAALVSLSDWMVWGMAFFCVWSVARSMTE